jgi:hypothetical protein
MVQGGIFLRKTPLGIEDSVKTRIETAVAKGGPRTSIIRTGQLHWLDNMHLNAGLMQQHQNASSRHIASTISLMHNDLMRTTITLDEDVYELATLYSKGRGVTLGAALSELARKGATAPPPNSPSSRLVRAKNGLLVFAPRGRAITSEMVKAALEEDELA